MHTEHRPFHIFEDLEKWEFHTGKRVIELDEHSRAILTELGGTTPELVERLGIKRQKIHYRLKNKLVPAGLAEEGEVVKDSNAPEPPKRWRATPKGDFVLDQLGDELERPVTEEQRENLVEEARDTAYDAKSMAGKANKTTQNIEREIEEIQNTVRSLQSEVKSEAGPEAVDELADQIGSLEESIVIINQDLDGLRDQFSYTKGLIDANTSGLEDAASRAEKNAEAIHDLQYTIDSLESKVDKITEHLKMLTGVVDGAHDYELTIPSKI